MKKQILVLCTEHDISIDPVVEKLNQAGALVFKFPTEKFPVDASLDISISSNSIISKFVLHNDLEFSLEEIHSIWYRHPGKPIPDSSLGIRESMFAHEECSLTLEGLWRTKELDTFWVSKPSMMRKCSYRIYQLNIARNIGFEIPHTIISNNPNEIIKFYNDNKLGIIVKSIGAGVPVIENGIRQYYEVVFTHKINENDIISKIDSLRFAPCICQVYVPKALELRVTVVGDRVFCCAIHSQAHEDDDVKIDWRRVSPSEIKHEIYELPKIIKTKCIDLVKTLGLMYGAIDLIKKPDNSYVFLEINCDGQFGWVEHFTKMPINDALVNLLLHHN